MEKRTFLLCDDSHENFFVGRITRTQNQIKPELWNLKIGDCLQGDRPQFSFIRES